MIQQQLHELCTLRPVETYFRGTKVFLLVCSTQTLIGSNSCGHFAWPAWDGSISRRLKFEIKVISYLYMGHGHLIDPRCHEAQDVNP